MPIPSFDLILTSQSRRVEALRFLRTLHNQGVTICVKFADQGLDFTDSDLSFIKCDSSLTIETIRIANSPLSKARNDAISLGITSQYVAFPDDDCWYQPNFLSKIDELFVRHQHIDCICTNVYDPEAQKYYGNRPIVDFTAVNYKNIFDLPISVGIFIRSSVFIESGAYFNEMLGAGTPLGSGEETELIARLLALEKRIMYMGSLNVYHPSINYESVDLEKFYKYGEGFGFLATSLISHGHYVVALNLLNVILRSFAGAIANIHKPRKCVSYLNRGLGIAVGVIRAMGVKKNDCCL